MILNIDGTHGTGGTDHRNWIRIPSSVPVPRPS